MEGHMFLLNIFIFLAAAVISVPVSKKLGFGSVLGYLIAGLAIGPWGLKLITDVHDIMSFAEFGVVLLLFLIGLELEPKKLWSLRVSIFGMGGAQVLLNMLLVTGISFFFLQSLSLSLLIGMAFSLSSTAMALQVLNEKKLMATESGRSAFAILLFQDLAVIPMIAILPLLGTAEISNVDSPAWYQFLKIVLVLAAVILVGRHVVRYLLKQIASLQLREIFTALALLLVVGMATLMTWLHVSMALGAFLAGVLLAESEYRKAIETDIEPFKGLLLGLFFISVGMSIDIGGILKSPLVIFGVSLGIIALKYAVHFFIGRLFKLPKSQIPFFSLVISQVGEFAFVLLGAAQAFNLLAPEISGQLIAITAITMFLTPVMVMSFDQIHKRFFSESKPESDSFETQATPVIIAGFGRFGQIVGRLLYANKISATILDYEPGQIEILRRFGFKVFYGDATRLDLLESAGAHQAQILVIAIDDAEGVLRLADVAKQHFPHLKIYARARNLGQVYDLMDRNIQYIERETFEASLKMGGAILHDMGLPAYQSQLAMHKFRAHNISIIKEIYPIRKDQAEAISRTKQSRLDLEKMFEEEAEILHNKDLGWERF